MRYRALSPTGDFSFGKGGQDYLTGTEAIAQAVRTRLLLLLGEWWEDQEDGLPLFQRILGSRGDDRGRQAVDRIVLDRIQGTPGVRAVTAFESACQGRAYSFTATVETTEGEETTVEVNW